MSNSQGISQKKLKTCAFWKENNIIPRNINGNIDQFKKLGMIIITFSMQKHTFLKNFNLGMLVIYKQKQEFRTRCHHM